jgi:hypothetical protein
MRMKEAGEERSRAGTFGLGKNSARHRPPGAPMPL